MKHFSSRIAIFLAGMILSGCAAQQQAGTQNQERTQTQEQAQSGPQDWTSALMSGKQLRCAYKMSADAGGGEVTMTMDQNRYRTEASTATGKSVSLFDGDTSYTWVEGAKRGTKISSSCMDEISQSAPATETEPVRQKPYQSPEDALQSIPDISCHEISDADFFLPSEVIFTDQCEMMRSQLKTIQQYQNQMPGSVKNIMRQQR